MSSSTANSFLDIFASPIQVFDRIREKQLSAWLPLLTLVVLATALMAWYMMSVDLYQFMETSMTLGGRTPTSDELDTVLQQGNILRIVTIATSGIGSIVVYLLLALFFFLAGLVVAEEKISYGQFLSVVAWGSLPSLISALSSVVSMIIANDFVFITALDKTSLASILGMTIDSNYYDIASIVSIGTVWSYVLYGVGFAIVTRSSVMTGSIVGVIPPAIHFGLIYLF